MSQYQHLDRKIAELTSALSKKCSGHSAGVVIGAALNVIMTSAQLVPDEKVRAALAASFRNLAESLDQQNSTIRQ